MLQGLTPPTCQGISVYDTIKKNRTGSDPTIYLDDCPIELYDMYIEVGEIKESEEPSQEYRRIEVWIASTFSKGFTREECKHPSRRPIYDVVKQIEAMCKDKQAYVEIMGDDKSDDTVKWGFSVSLLLSRLKYDNALKGSVLYTGGTKEQTEKFIGSIKWRRAREEEAFHELFDILDDVVYEKANRYEKIR